ncbi:MAG: hypothetical protein GY821_05005 [Gammaproteobacteria bacterium]|nr:hypothetical protein [Gammaproteobacteria bacterium]
MKYLLLLGWPLSLQFGSELLSGVVTTLMIGHMNRYAVSVQQATNQARIFIVMVPFGIGQGCAMLVSRYEKAQRLKALADFIYLLNRALIIGLAMMLPLLLWLLVKPDSFIALFFHSSTTAAIKQLARQFLYIVIMALLFDLLKFSLGGWHSLT